MKYIKRFFNFLWNEIPSRFSTIFGVLYVFFYLWFFRPFNNELWHDKSGAGIAIVIIIIGSALPTAIAAGFVAILFIFENKFKIKTNPVVKNVIYKLFILTFFGFFIIMSIAAIAAVLIIIINSGFVYLFDISLASLKLSIDVIFHQAIIYHGLLRNF